MIDTSGLEPFLPGDTIQARATQLTARVLNRSDVALLLIDGRWGWCWAAAHVWPAEPTVRTAAAGC